MGATGGAVDVALIGARVMVAVLLLRAALGKARAPRPAIVTITEVVGVRPAGLSASIVWLLVAAELVAGITLLAGFHVGVVSALVVATMVGFTAVLLVRRARGVKVGCGCFGGNSAQESLGASVVRNAMIAGAAGAVSIQALTGPTSYARLPVWSLSAEDLAVGVLLALTAWLFWIVIGTVAALQVAPKANS